MPDHVLKILDGEFAVAHGLTKTGQRSWSFNAPDTDKTTVKIDYTRWLDGATISTILVTASGLTSTNADTTTATTLTLSAVAGGSWAEVKATASDGRILTVTIEAQRPDHWPRTADYSH